jgi:D-amino-acid dehydrogenase
MNRLVVIGAGIVGACAALAAQREGFAVTILDPGEPGGEQAASYGNGCWLSPYSVIPPAVPGLWRKLPGFLRDPLGPLAIRPSRLPAAAPWLLRYLASGWTEERVLRTALVLRELLDEAPALHAALAAEAGHGELIEQRGLLYLYPDRAAFEAEALAWRIRAAVGLSWSELEGETLRAAEPLVDPRYRLGILGAAGGHCRDPGAHVAGLVRLAEARGAARLSSPASGLIIEAGRLRTVRTAQGDVPADRAIIAAGIASAPLAAMAGSRVPLESERGYHAEILGTNLGPNRPIMPADGKMSLTRTARGLRAAGQVEIAGFAAEPDWRRADILRDRLLSVFPDLPRDLPASRVRFWMGHRPSTPDGLPVIGPARASADVILCFGHGHVGLAAGPRSALWAATLAAGGAMPAAAAACAPGRFG